jgi:hypothetical protein
MGLMLAFKAPEHFPAKRQIEAVVREKTGQPRIN